MKVRAKKHVVVREKRKLLPGRLGDLQILIEEHGKKTIVPAVALLIALLYFLNLFSDLTVAAVIIVCAGIAAFGIFAYQIISGEFPKWTKLSLACVFLFFAVGVIYPSFRTVFPGSPVINVEISKEQGEVKLDGLLSSGYYLMYVNSPAIEHGSKGIQGEYSLSVSGSDIGGKFFDIWRQGRVGRRGVTNVEQRHPSERHKIYFDAGNNILKVNRLDSSIGPTLKVAFYKYHVPFFLIIIFTVLLVLYGVFLDVYFLEETKKKMLSVWMVMGAFFVFFYDYSMEPTRVLSTTLWSLLISAIAGFLLGWLFSWLGRKIGAKVRVRI